MYDIDRKTASKLLKVSIRTLDRYVKAGKLSTQNLDGRVYLDKEEVSLIRKAKEVPYQVDRGVRVDRIDTIDTSIVDMSIDRVGKIVHSLSTPKAPKIENSYQNLQHENKEKQKYIEYANYKIGQLETELRHRVPLLEVYKTIQKLQDYEKELHHQKNSRNILFLILIILLILQPLLVYLITSG